MYNLYFTDYAENRRMKALLPKEEYIDYVKKILKHSKKRLKARYSEKVDWDIHLAEKELESINKR